MKQFLIYATILCSFMSACQNVASHNNNTDATTATEEDKPDNVKKISKRDLSIDKSNSYSNLFIDSAVVESFIAQKQLSDTIARRIRSFYNARNYQLAWFSSDGLTEQALGFWNLHDYHTGYSGDKSLHDKELQRKMDKLITEEDLLINTSDKSTQTTELTLTQHFIQFALGNYDKGYVKRKEMERFVPMKKVEVMIIADSILTKKHKDNKYYEDINSNYKALKDQLATYYTIAKSGGWQAIEADKKTYKSGVSSPVIASIKKRLQISGTMPGTDTSQLFTDTLATAVKSFQQQLGYTPNGIITDALLKEMNVPVQHRLAQILMNMDRMRWMPEQPDGNLILVNIPEFVLHVYEAKKKAFDMNVVVGKEGHNTMMFTGDLNQVVFSPYWNVPESIVEKEILPAIQLNPNYLADHNMEMTNDEGSLPIIRQLPGEKNSLGRVKFLFPNSFNIYFHDTPAKSLFSKDKRAYSHGCIRLAEPEKMAQYLLRNNPEWDDSKIFEAMNSEEEKYVKLKKPVPVFISYYTAWVDDNGLLNFREDIYGHDKKLAQKMFTNVL